MTVDFMTFNRARDEDPACLAVAPRADVVKALSGWLASWEACSSVDDEAIYFAGLLVHRSGHVGVDQDVVDWVRAAPTPFRREVAGYFLWGYWATARTLRRPSLDFLTAALANLPVESSAYAATLLALYPLALSRKAPMTEAERQNLRADLLARAKPLQAQGLHPGIVALLAELADRP